VRCPLCGKGTLVKEVRELAYTYRGKTTTIRQRGRYCAVCKEVIFATPESESYIKAVKAFRAQVNADLLSPSEVRRIRKRLGLIQHRASEIFGGGARAFLQYERGETRQDKATDKLLRLLDKHPELLAELVSDKAA